jgi:hypothetical protein
MVELSRAQLIARGVRGGVALAAGGALLASAMPAQAGVVEGSGPPEEDLAVVRLAASAELLAQAFYRKAIGSRKFDREDRGYLSAALANEREHYASLAKVLGDVAPIADDFVFTFGAGAFRSVASITKLGVALETAFVGAYLGAVDALLTPELRSVAAQIAASEAMHLSVLADIHSGAPVGNPFPVALTVEQASDALDPFLG